MALKINIIKRKLLHNNVVFIDGIAKSGKIVIASILNTLKNCENFSIRWRYNNYLKFKNFRLLDENLAIDLVLQDIQILMIENCLSRNLNFRKYDLSSVNNSLKKKEYYKNLKIKDNKFEVEKIIKKIKKKKNIIPIMVDDFFPNCTGKFKYFFNFKKIIMMRSPIGIFYENLTKNRVHKQIIGHPWTIGFHYKKNGKKIPWFVDKKEIKTFFSCKKIDRIIMFLNSEYAPYLNKKIFKIKKTKILFLEDIWQNPLRVVKTIAKFLETSMTSFTHSRLKSLELPRKNLDKDYQSKLVFLKKKLNNEQFKKIINMEEKYDLIRKFNQI